MAKLIRDLIEYVYLILQFIWELMSMRRGPQDMPSSRLFVKTLIVLYFLINIIATFTTKTPNIVFAIGTALIEVVFTAAFVKLVTTIFHFPSRFHQTFSALLAVHLGFLILSIPLQHLFLPLVAATGDIEAMEQLKEMPVTTALRYFAMFVWFACFIWYVRAQTYIYSIALEVRTVFALAVVITQWVLSFIVITMGVQLFGPAPL